MSRTLISLSAILLLMPGMAALAAGDHAHNDMSKAIKEYRDLCKKYPTFRQRSEIPEVAVEVSLQPWRNYQTDGCILFSDILTPLPGVGCEFTIDEKLGPIMDPIKTWDDAKKVRRIVCHRCLLWIRDFYFAACSFREVFL